MAVVVAGAAGGCGWRTTTEVADGGWSTMEFQGPGGGPWTEPAPQVMAEVTTPDGSAPPLPQPSVPAAEPPSVLRAPEPATTRVPERTVPAPSPPPPPADAGRAVEALRSPRARTVAAEALARIRYDWRTFLPGWQLRFLPGRAGYRGSTFPQRRVIEVYVRDGDDPDGLSHVIAHEIGHAVDVTLLDDGERAAWRAARGITPEAPWFPGASGAADYSTGAGDFAESFARWQTGVGWYSRLGPPPTPIQTGLLARLVLPN